MPRRQIQFTEGSYYHVYSRGAEKCRIFFNAENYLHFIRLMAKYAGQHHMSLIAYCLMPNHFHFVVRIDRGNALSLFMSRLLNAYVKGLNSVRGRTGSLFSQRFGCKPVTEEDYFLHLCRYVHRNPLAAGLVMNLNDWPFSNYLEWIGVRRGQLYDRTVRKRYFATAADYEDFVLQPFEDEGTPGS